MIGREASEEVRFAVVLNGGVSLAVWMGGAVLELDAVTRGDGTYGELLQLFGISARADVIAGTSAGGINGAALALSQVNKHADLSLLRDLWAEQGRMDELLRRPFEEATPSLLRGDDYFLPNLCRAMEQLTRGWDPVPAADRPIDLTITTTLLSGAREVNVDALGQPLPQLVHEGRFYFRRGMGEYPGDDFAEYDDRGRAKPPPADLAARLALAARATAGFPIAFEPTFIPAVASRDGRYPPLQTRDANRPDMGAFVNWRDAGPASELPADRSRFAVDGGLLANTPTRDALAAIGRMKASTPVRRVMLLVFPHAPENRNDPADSQSDDPKVTETVAGLLGAMASQGSRTFVDQVEAHNQRAASRRGTRTDILAAVKSPAGLRELAEHVFVHYQALRFRRSARDLAARFKSPTDWSFERIRGAIEQAQDDILRTGHPLPYVPPELPVQPWLPGLTGHAWGWGTTTALDLADIALDLSQRLARVADQAEAGHLDGPRRLLHDAAVRLRATRDADERLWTKNPVLAALPPDVAYWKFRAGTYAWLMTGLTRDASDTARYRDEVVADLRGHNPADPVVGVIEAGPNGPLWSAHGKTTVKAVADVVQAMRQLLPVLLRERDAAVDAMVDLEPWRVLFEGVDEGTFPRAELLVRMLWLHVVSWTMADEVMLENTSPVDLVQVSLQTHNAFARRSVTADDKAGGFSLARFSGFLKRSWRQNDWTWGRCDAASMLMQTLLTPARVRRYAVLNGLLSADEGQQSSHAGALVETIVEAVFKLPTSELPVALRELAESAVAEMSAQFVKPLDESERNDAARVAQVERMRNAPPALTSLARLVAWARHIEIGLKELPALEVAVSADLAEGGNARSRGALFLLEAADVLDRIKALPPVCVDVAERRKRVDVGLEALDAFDRAGVGREDLRQEGTSDQMIRTAATAASVAVTLADSPASGLTAVKPVTRGIRGAALLPYWILLGLTGGGRILNALSMMALSIGALLLGLSLLGLLGDWSSAGAAIGGATALCAFGYAALRTGSMLHGLVLLTPVVPLIALCIQLIDDQNGGEEASKAAAYGVVGTLAFMVTAFVVLGSIRNPLRSPLATVGIAVRQRQTWYGLLAIAVAVGVGWLLITYWRDPSGVIAGFADWLTSGWGLAFVIVVVVLGAAFSFLNGRLLARYEWDDRSGLWTGQQVEHPGGVAASWSAVYGFAYLVAALLLAGMPDLPVSGVVRWSSVFVGLVFAFVLLLVVPNVVWWRAHRSLQSKLVAEVRGGFIAITDDLRGSQTDLRGVLERRGQTYRYLVRAVPADSAGGAANRLALRRLGVRLAARLRTEAATRAIGPPAAPPRV
jgi:patatin-related protein